MVRKSTYAKSTMQTIPHDGDELRVTQTAVVINVEYLEDRIHDVGIQSVPR